MIELEEEALSPKQRWS